MELRGLGRHQHQGPLRRLRRSARRKRVELVVSLERWEAGTGVRPAGPAGREVPDPRGRSCRSSACRWRPGRNLAILVEVAARNQLLRSAATTRRAGSSERVDEMIGPAAARPHGRRRRRRAPAGADGGRRRARSTRRRATPVRGPLARPPREPRILVITGLSGSGKTHVRAPSRTPAGSAWTTCPPRSSPRFADLSATAPELHRSALVVDMRERGLPEAVPARVPAAPRQGRSRPASSSWRRRRGCCSAASARRGGPIPWPSTSPRSRASARSGGPAAHPQDGRPHPRHLGLHRAPAPRLHPRALRRAPRSGAGWWCR